MRANKPKTITEEYLDHIRNKPFPCVAAKAVLARQQIRCFEAVHMACPGDDRAILQFLYQFVDEYRNSENQYHSAAILFRSPDIESEEKFDMLLWQRLQALSDMDAKNYPYDKRVVSDIDSEKFSFSLKEEAFYIIGLHPVNNRQARRFKYPALIFNPHTQFEELRKAGKYDSMKMAIRKRDIAYSGSTNPMLADFGLSSEVFQYSGRQYDKSWKCPLNIKHEKIKHSSTS